MLALIYFALAICVGDFLCRRFYRFVSVAHRCAAALLVGLLISTWFTYLAGLAFAWTARPLLCLVLSGSARAAELAQMEAQNCKSRSRRGSPLPNSRNICSTP